MQRRLQDANIKHPFAQTHRSGMRCDKFTDNVRPRVDDFGFMQTFAQSEALNEFRQHIAYDLATIGARFSFRETAPLGDDSGA